MELRVQFCSDHTLQWIKLKNLGEGAYGDVVDLVEMIKPAPMLLAVKSSHSPSFSIRKESRILRCFVGCPNIVQCYASRSTFERKVEYDSLFLEYATGGNLMDLIHKYGGKIPECDVRRYTKMILQGLSHIHKRGYVHCDIKPENILVYPSDQSGSRFTLKLADFGSAKEPDEPMPRRGCFRGTGTYMSPESVKHGEITGALDIWSLGCVVVQMMTGEQPWKSSADDIEELRMRIACSSDMPADIPQEMSMAGRDFLESCFARDTRQRWTADRLINHRFVSADESPLMEVAPRNQILLPHEMMQKS